MAKTISNIEDVMRHIAEQDNETRGELLATRILLFQGLDILFSTLTNKEELLNELLPRSLKALENVQNEGDDDSEIIALKRCRTYLFEKPVIRADPCSKSLWYEQFPAEIDHHVRPSAPTPN